MHVWHDVRSVIIINHATVLQLLYTEWQKLTVSHGLEPLNFFLILIQLPGFTLHTYSSRQKYNVTRHVKYNAKSGLKIFVHFYTP